MKAKKKPAKTKPPRKARRRAHPIPAPAPQGGRKRIAPISGFGRWLDKQDLGKVADAIGLSRSSLYQVRRGDQGLSSDKLLELLDYAKGELTASDFKPDAPKQ